MTRPSSPDRCSVSAGAHHGRLNPRHRPTYASLFTAAGKHGLLGFSVPEKLGGPAVDDFRYNAIVVEEEGQPQTARQQLLLALAVAEFVGMLAIAVVVAKLSRQAIRPLATALALQRRFVDDASHELRARVTDTGD